MVFRLNKQTTLICTKPVCYGHKIFTHNGVSFFPCYPSLFSNYHERLCTLTSSYVLLFSPYLVSFSFSLFLLSLPYSSLVSFSNLCKTKINLCQLNSAFLVSKNSQTILNTGLPRSMLNANQYRSMPIKILENDPKYLSIKTNGNHCRSNFLNTSQ